MMDLPKMEAGNRHVVVFQDFLAKWPMVFPVPDQKAIRLACLLADEEALVPDCDIYKPLTTHAVPLQDVRDLETEHVHPQ